MIANVNLMPLITELTEAVKESYLCDNPTLRRSDIDEIVSKHLDGRYAGVIPGGVLKTQVLALHGVAEQQVIYKALELYQRTYSGDNEYHLKLAQDMFQSYHDDYVKDVK